VRVVADQQVGLDLRDRLHAIARHRDAVLDRSLEHALHLADFIPLLRGKTRGLQRRLRCNGLLRRNGDGGDRSRDDDRC